MEVRFLQTAQDLYNYLIDSLLHVQCAALHMRSGKRPVAFSFHVKLQNLVKLVQRRFTELQKGSRASMHAFVIGSRPRDEPKPGMGDAKNLRAAG